mmetsp:Transcript_49260/g.130020  ORF Transcript_49260/g.130020 Transcript_49260/m.130020 type:complete len:291 (-) Transcript_49260:237-1109(-)
MKLKATFKQDSLLLLSKATTSISQGSGNNSGGARCTWELCPATVTLAHRVSSAVAGDDLVTNVMLHTPDLFMESKIESKNANRINLQLPLQGFAEALKASSQALSTVLRLTKRDGAAMLAFEYTMPGVAAGSAIQQFLPVEAILTDEQAAVIRELSVPEPEFQLYFPGVHVLKSMVDRMKSLGAHHVRVKVQKGPEGDKATMEVACESGQAQVATKFPNLAITMEQKALPCPDFAEVVMPISRLQSLIGVCSVGVQRTVLCVAQGRALLVYMGLSHGVGTFMCVAPVSTE